MKLLVGDGSKVEVRDVGEVIYTMEINSNIPLPLHGSHIMSDDGAREFINKYKHLSNNKSHV